MPRHGLVPGPSCPCVCQVCTALPDEALCLWLDPGSLSVKPNHSWGSHVVGSGLGPGVSCPVSRRRGLGHRGGLSGQQMGLQGTSQGCATSQSREPGPPHSMQGGARLTLKSSRPTDSPDWELLKEHLEPRLSAK